MYWPNTRLVKNPRASLTVIGILPICSTKSIARDSVSGLVSLPRMISTSCILSTGLKKCRPMKRSGSALALARSVIGMVEVFDEKMPPSARNDSAFRVTSALIAGSSNTASITRSQPCSAAKSVVAVIRSSTAWLSA